MKTIGVVRCYKTHVISVDTVENMVTGLLNEPFPISLKPKIFW